MRINGLDYDRRESALRRAGIDPDGDDTAFGATVWCNQHRREHTTGWCTVSNREKWNPAAPVCPCCADGLPDCTSLTHTHSETCATRVWAKGLCPECKGTP